MLDEMRVAKALSRGLYANTVGDTQKEQVGRQGTGVEWDGGTHGMEVGLLAKEVTGHSLLVVAGRGGRVCVTGGGSQNRGLCKLGLTLRTGACGKAVFTSLLPPVHLVLITSSGINVPWNITFGDTV